MSKLEFYTDGAYSFTRETGGVGVVVVKDGEKVYEFSKTYPKYSNNRCELLAVIHSLNAISKPVESIVIYTDSQYVIGGATLGWKRKANVDLWNLYDKYYTKASEFCKDITFSWIKGHSKGSTKDEQFNNLADTLAVSASHKIS